MNLTGNFFLASAKKFLSDTAISFTLIILLLIIKPTCIMSLDIPKNLSLFFSVVALFLSYPVGLFINACSHFLFSGCIKKREESFFKNGKKASQTKIQFKTTQTRAFFKIKNFEDYYNVSEILRKMRFVFKKWDKDIDYVEGLNQYLRNICFVIIALNAYVLLSLLFQCVIKFLFQCVIKLFVHIDVSFPFCFLKNMPYYFQHHPLYICFTTFFFLLFSFFVIWLLLNLCARLNFYYSCFNMHVAYTFANTLSRNDISEDMDAESIAYELMGEFAEYSSPEPAKEIVLNIKNLK